MHLLIILLQQLLGMLPGSKKVPQPEVVRKTGTNPKTGANPNPGEPDACGRIAPPLSGWMTPFEALHCVADRRSALVRVRWRFSMAALRAHRPAPAEPGARRPRI
jgi:hypothetical protein